MKKLLSLLSVVTIAAASIPSVIATSPYQKQKTKSENIEISYLQTNSLEKLNRIRRNDNNEVVIHTGEYDDRLIFLRNDFDFKWLPIWGLNWIIKINKSGIMKVLNLIENNPDRAKYAGSIMAGVICGAAASYATDYLSQHGYSWPTTAVYFSQALISLSSGFATYKILGSRIVKQMIDLVKNPNFHFSAVWVAFEATRIKEQFGTVDNSGNIGDTSSISSSDSYYTANDDTDDTSVLIRDELK